MSKLHVSQISGYLKKNLEGKLDLSDYAHHGNLAERDRAFLTRALAALAPSYLTDRPIIDFVTKVTDGSNDGGIDLIHFNEENKTLYLVQTKWHEDGHGSISQGDILKFINGVKKIIDLKLDGFNDKVKARIDDIKGAVYDANAKIVLVVAHTGADSLGGAVLDDLKSYVAGQNDTSEIMSLEILNQPVLHKAVSAGLAGNPIEVDVQLLNWGQLQLPRKAVYGRVFVSDVANWFQQNGSRLFESNLRQFLPSSSVNQDLVETLMQRPEEFWYFNNGITAISRSVEKKPLGGNQTDTGIWECKGFSVVNGAQTVGSIHSAFAIDPGKVGAATVSIRIIEIEDDGDSFGLEVTRNTNTQNSVEKRDFVALDPEQDRIRQELRFDGIDYTYKSGAIKGEPTKSVDLTEATLALVCSSADVGLAVQAKREIGRLWEDIQKIPYKALFNGAISGPQVWQLVLILRDVERSLSMLAKGLEGRDLLISIHGNRFIQWLAFRMLSVNKNTKHADISTKIASTAERALNNTIKEVQASYPDSYPASLFKNQAKCKMLAEKTN